MSQNTLIPTEMPQPPDADTKRAVINIITAIQDAIHQEGASLAGEWAEKADCTENIFMRDRAEAVLAQYVAGFIERMQPRANQFTDEHASAFLGIPPANDPVKP